MLRIISYNIRGITTYKKQQLLKIWLNQTQHDIVMLQETHMTKFKHLNQFNNSFLDYNIKCALGTWSAGGVLIMIKKKYNIIDCGSDAIGRIVHMKIEYNQLPILLVNVYAPTQITERCDFFKDLFLYLPTTKWTIIGGDFNCTPNNQIDRSQLALQPDNLSYRTLLREVINPLLLIEVFRRKHPRKINYSYHADAGYIHSRIDLFFSTNVIYKNVQEIFYSPVGISDHDALIMIVKIPLINNDKSFRRWICKSDVTKRKTFIEKFRKIWNIIIKNADFNSTEWWKDFKTSLTMILQDEERQLNHEIRRKLNDLINEYRFRANDPTKEDLIKLDIIRQRIKDTLTEKFLSVVSNQVDRNLKCLGNLVKSRIAHDKANQSRIKFLIHSTKGRVENASEMMEIATNFYQDLYDFKAIDKDYWKELFKDLPTLSQEDSDFLEQDITMNECHEALKTMPLGKAPGDDGLTVEVWRIIFPVIGERYLHMINTAKLKGQFYNGFLNGLLTLLKKDEPLLNLMRRNRNIPGVLIPGSQYKTIAHKILKNDDINVEIKVLAYADDICSVVYNANDELETYAMFQKYSKASGAKTNEDKTKIFWISDSIDPPVFNAKILQKICNTFFWGNIHPFVKFHTCVGRKEDGGFGLIHLESLVISYRIKCGLTITSATPKIWQFFALPYVGLHLYKYAPWLWSNLIPHFNDDNHFFGEVAINTAKWLRQGNEATKNEKDKSIYWKFINKNIYRPPVCYERIDHLKNIPFYKTIHYCNLSSNIIEFWTSLANFGINTRDRLGKTMEEKKCLFCPLPETLSHLFITCSYFEEIFKLLFEYIKNKFSLSITRNGNEIIYLHIISSITSNKIQKQVTYTIGNYLYAIWSYRCIMKNGSRKNQLRRCREIFMTNMRYLPFDNG
ncbi:unnamed protein product [Adineta steineri]|uniref:exodeoxyribonuclease III n=1 Tax=Adineta steineri TaxID=433720 RepID=A0A818KWL7_9BILA|nr:unnamed protein product [Adineta steineri]